MLSPEELTVLQDRSFLPLKHSACLKIEAQLALLRDEIGKTFDPAVPEALRKSGGKISRGENYHTYAYRVLDCPSVFRKEDIFTFRTLVLWGHYIGFHLLLTGAFKEQYQEKLIAEYGRLQGDFWLSREDIPWQWLLNEAEQVPLAGLEADALREILAARKFLKVSVYLPLSRYAELPATGAALWQQWQQLLWGA